MRGLRVVFVAAVAAEASFFARMFFLSLLPADAGNYFLPAILLAARVNCSVVTVMDFPPVLMVTVPGGSFVGVSSGGGSSPAISGQKY